MTGYVICGQTATGKSDLGVMLAKKYSGEVISCDSRQVYRGLSVGSNVISTEDMRGAIHHMIGVAEPGVRYTVHDFQKHARGHILDISNRGSFPLLVGGTGLYIDATLYSHYSFGGKRASPPSESWEIDAQLPIRGWRHIGLTAPRDFLIERIRVRSEKKRDTVVAEISGLIDSGVSVEWLLGLGLEFRYGTELLQGKISSIEYSELLTTATWHYAKRQMTWFRRNTRIEWHDVSKTSIEEVFGLAINPRI